MYTREGHRTQRLPSTSPFSLTCESSPETLKRRAEHGVASRLLRKDQSTHVDSLLTPRCILNGSCGSLTLTLAQNHSFSFPWSGLRGGYSLKSDLEQRTTSISGQGCAASSHVKALVVVWCRSWNRVLL